MSELRGSESTEQPHEADRPSQADQVARIKELNALGDAKAFDPRIRPYDPLEHIRPGDRSRSESEVGDGPAALRPPGDGPELVDRPRLSALSERVKLLSAARFEQPEPSSEAGDERSDADRLAQNLDVVQDSGRLKPAPHHAVTSKPDPISTSSLGGDVPSATPPEQPAAGPSDAGSAENELDQPAETTTELVPDPLETQRTTRDLAELPEDLVDSRDISLLKPGEPVLPQALLFKSMRGDPIPAGYEEIAAEVKGRWERGEPLSPDDRVEGWDREANPFSPLGRPEVRYDPDLPPDEAAALREEGLERARTVVGRDNWSNAKYAGSVYQFGESAPELRERFPAGVPFSYEGFPQFDDYALARVEFEDGFSGNRQTDSRRANRLVGNDATPEGTHWHHVEDGRTMLLLDSDLHDGVRHWGGILVNKQISSWDLPAKREDEQR